MLSLTINGQERLVAARSDKPLLWVLREDLKLTGSKYGCGQALCGACTVQLDGQPTRACVLPVGSVGARAVTTIEGIATSELGRRVQQAWAELNVPQCGYCQSGQVVATVALLQAIPQPTDQDIDEALSGNLCRCGMYLRIRQAIHRVADEIAGG